MSIVDYLESQQLSKDDPTFYALIMAAIRKADTNNLELLSSAFPQIKVEFVARYNAPGGALNDHDFDILETEYQQKQYDGLVGNETVEDTRINRWINRCETCNEMFTVCKAALDFVDRWTDGEITYPSDEADNLFYRLHAAILNETRDEV